MRITKVIAILSLVGLALGCDEEQKADQSAARARAEKKSGVEAFEEEGDDEGQSSDAVGEVSESSPYTLLCRGMMASSVATGPLADYAERFCTPDGMPKKLLTQKLPELAFSGSGEPKLVQIAETEHDDADRTSRMQLGGAVLIPMSAKKYFDTMTSFMDDQARALELGIKLIEGVRSVDVLGEYVAEEEFHVKGWDTHVIIDRNVVGQKLVIEYESRQDHWEFAEGKAYLIGGYLTQTIQSLKETRLFTALVEVGPSETLVLSLIDTKTDNHGLPSVAREEIIKTVREGIVSSLNNADIIASMDE